MSKSSGTSAGGTGGNCAAEQLAATASAGPFDEPSLNSPTLSACLGCLSGPVHGEPSFVPSFQSSSPVGGKRERG
eukprot:3575228-Pyramimonas_sp.AAC.1